MMFSMNEARAIEILLVEDNPGDVRLTVEALKDAKVRNIMRVATDGEMALEMLRGDGSAWTTGNPDLVLLDLNLPKLDGHEVLATIKADPELRRIPVVVLTTSAAEQDILKTYDLHANCYITKPVDISRFIEVVRTIEGFWLSVVRLPHRSGE